MKRINQLIASLLFLCQGVFAQEYLTLSQCREMALEQNKQLAASVQQIEYARHTASSYKANFFPDFKLNGTGLYSTSKGNLPIQGGNLPVFVPGANGAPTPNGGFAYFPGVDLNYKVGWAYMGGVSVQQPLYMGGKIRSAYKIANLGKEMAFLNKTLTETEVLMNTDRAYAMLIKAQEMQKVTQAYYKTLEELMKNVESAFRHGLKLRNDVLKVQVKLNEAEINKRKAENALRLATMNLCHYIGKPLTSTLTVSDEYPSVELSKKLNTHDISSRPEYNILNKQVEINRQQVKLTRSEMLPQIGVQGSYNYINGLDVNGQKFLDGGSFTALLNVSIPIFHFGERKHKVNAAKAKLQQSLLEQADKNELMLLEVTQAANNLEEAKLECDLADISLEQAEENQRVSAEQFKQGLETLSDHLEAQTLWQQAWQTKVDAHFQLYLEWIAYQKASGTLQVK